MPLKSIRRALAAFILAACCALALPATSQAASFRWESEPAVSVERVESRGFFAQLWGFMTSLWGATGADATPNG